jgi:hypothetical protein
VSVERTCRGRAVDQPQSGIRRTARTNSWIGKNSFEWARFNIVELHQISMCDLAVSISDEVRLDLVGPDIVSAKSGIILLPA